MWYFGGETLVIIAFTNISLFVVGRSNALICSFHWGLRQLLITIKNEVLCRKFYEVERNGLFAVTMKKGSAFQTCLAGPINEQLTCKIAPVVTNTSWESSTWIYLSCCSFGTHWLFFHRVDTYADHHLWSFCHLFCLVLYIQQPTPRSCSSDFELITGAAQLLGRWNRLWSEASLKWHI